MWIAKLTFKHNCILGRRCEKFKIALQSVAFSAFREGNKSITSSMHYMSGNPKNTDDFVGSLKEDKTVIKLERKGDTFFLLEKADKKAVGFYTPKIIFVKPVVTRPDGYETWEVGSWEREEMQKFIEKVRRTIGDVKLLKFSNVGLDNVFFPRLMPDLTSKQKRATEIAIHEGYYQTPRKTNLRKLARLMGVSLSTYEQHLRAAEEKLIPNLLHFSQ